MCPKSQILCSTLQTNSVKYNVVTVFLVKNCLGSYVNLCAYTQIQVKFTVDVIFSGKENIFHNTGCENSVWHYVHNSEIHNMTHKMTHSWTS
jgi:hypothetical protein